MKVRGYVVPGGGRVCHENLVDLCLVKSDLMTITKNLHVLAYEGVPCTSKSRLDHQEELDNSTILLFFALAQVFM